MVNLTPAAKVLGDQPITALPDPYCAIGITYRQYLISQILPSLICDGCPANEDVEIAIGLANELLNALAEEEQNDG